MNIPPFRSKIIFNQNLSEHKNNFDKKSWQILDGLFVCGL